MAKKSYAELKANMARMEAMLKEQQEKASRALAEGLVDDEVMAALDGLAPADIRKLAGGLKPGLIRAAGKLKAADHAADPVPDEPRADVEPETELTEMAVPETPADGNVAGIEGS